MEGLIRLQVKNKVVSAFTSGMPIGHETVLFPSLARGDYIVGDEMTRLAGIKSGRIRNLIKAVNIQKYTVIQKALDRVPVFRGCNSQELVSLIESVMNGPELTF